MCYDPEDDATSDIVHTVTLKCIGCTREPKHQKALERITELHGTGKKHTVEPPNNRHVGTFDVVHYLEVSFTGRLSYVLANDHLL